MPKSFVPFDKKYSTQAYHYEKEKKRDEEWDADVDDKDEAAWEQAQIKRNHRIKMRLLVTMFVLEEILVVKDLSVVKSDKYSKLKTRKGLPATKKDLIAQFEQVEKLAEKYSDNSIVKEGGLKEYQAYVDMLKMLNSSEDLSRDPLALSQMLDYVKTYYNARVSKWDKLPETDFFKEFERYVTARIDMLSTSDDEAQINALMCLMQPFENTKMQASAQALLIPFLADVPLRRALAAYPQAQETADILLLTICMVHGRGYDEDLLFLMQARLRLVGDEKEIPWEEFNLLREGLSHDAEVKVKWIFDQLDLLVSIAEKNGLKDNTPETLMIFSRDKLIGILAPAFKEENILESAGRRLSSWFNQFTTRKDTSKKEDKDAPRKPDPRGGV